MISSLITEIEFCKFHWFFFFIQQSLVFSREEKKRQFYTLKRFLMKNKYKKEVAFNVYFIIQKGKVRLSFLTHEWGFNNFWWTIWKILMEALDQNKVCVRGGNLFRSLCLKAIFLLYYIQLKIKDNEHFFLKNCFCCHPCLALKSGSYSFIF